MTRYWRSASAPLHLCIFTSFAGTWRHRPRQEPGSLQKQRGWATFYFFPKGTIHEKAGVNRYVRHVCILPAECLCHQRSISPDKFGFMDINHAHWHCFIRMVSFVHYLSANHYTWKIQSSWINSIINCLREQHRHFPNLLPLPGVQWPYHTTEIRSYYGWSQGLETAKHVSNPVNLNVNLKQK